ncbi:MAG: DUF1318 domain-containing protein [Rhodospirillales bacterium]|nr:MAG: DUF1318 domain-containing protein [Rhodospirillales bacterium]
MTSTPVPRRRLLTLLPRAVLAGAIGLAMAGIDMAPAWAQSLDQAKDAGFVGERPDGYVGLVRGDAPDWARDLVTRINAERRARYAEIARRTGASVRDVAIVAGEKLVANAPRGHYVMTPQGTWVQR